jgi:hypothetical protein
LVLFRGCNKKRTDDYKGTFFDRIKIYHFHDTTPEARINVPVRLMITDI